jgi:hypothetical protein
MLSGKEKDIMFVKQWNLLEMQQHSAVHLNKHSQGQWYDVDLSCFKSWAWSLDSVLQITSIYFVTDSKE